MSEFGDRGARGFTMVKEDTMVEKIQLCRADKLEEGAPLAVTLPSMPPLAVYRLGDSYFVTDNTCTHGNAMLTEGYQDGGIIECPFHGGTFDIQTGEAKTFPCQVALRTYPASVVEGWILIEKPVADSATSQPS